MKDKYLIVRLVFEGEILNDMHDLMLEEYRLYCLQMESIAASLGAEVLFSESYNNILSGRSFVAVEHNFPIEDEKRVEIVRCLTKFFIDGNLVGGKIDTYNTLKAVRFLQTSGVIVGLE